MFCDILGSLRPGDVQARFLKHFEQLKDAGERLPRFCAVSAYPPLEALISRPADVEEKANRLPRRW